jgi:hypothetical protein
VVQLIAYVKVDLVNQIHDSGVKKHGMSITKSRPKEEMLKIESDGKYVRRKKGQVFLSEVMHKVEKKTGILPKQDFHKDSNNNANEENENKTSPPSVAPMAMVPNNEMMAPPNMIEMEIVPGVTNHPIGTTIDPEDIATASSMKEGKKNQ